MYIHHVRDFFSLSFGFYHFIDTIGTVTVCGSHGCVWVFLHVSVLTPLPLTEVIGCFPILFILQVQNYCMQYVHYLDILHCHDSVP